MALAAPPTELLMMRCAICGECARYRPSWRRASYTTIATAVARFRLRTCGLAIGAFLQFMTLSTAAIVAGVALVITSLEGWLLTPMLMGRAARMNPVALFVGLLSWSWMWGVWGTLLAVPMMMVLKAICDHVEDFAPVSDFLSE